MIKYKSFLFDLFRLSVWFPEASDLITRIITTRIAADFINDYKVIESSLKWRRFPASRSFHTSAPGAVNPTGWCCTSCVFSFWMAGLAHPSQCAQFSCSFTSLQKYSSVALSPDSGLLASNIVAEQKFGRSLSLFSWPLHLCVSDSSGSLAYFGSCP